MYGKAGAFRPKTYGVEYRTLSNAWLFSKKLQSFVYRGVQRAVDKALDPAWRPSAVVQKIIDSSDRNHPILKKNILWDEVNDMMAA